MSFEIDVNYDVRKDLDVDSMSITLRKYHKKLWSKSLPNGNDFILIENKNEYHYLIHKSDLGVFYLSSDIITATYSDWKRMEKILDIIPYGQIRNFDYYAHTIGSFLIFPGNQINELNTINQHRGGDELFDRIDLTLECIRLYYKGISSPLFDTIKRYKSYFDLFCTFEKYCDYFLLDDLLTEDKTAINYFLPFNGFDNVALPSTIDEYNLYMENCISFIKRRNSRINKYCREHND